MTATMSKTTVAQALGDALDIIRVAQENESRLSDDAFLTAMEECGVELSAAQDTLRFLKGTREFEVDQAGSVRATRLSARDDVDAG